MNFLIADNDKVSRQQLSSMIKNIPGCIEVGYAGDGVEAIYKSYKLRVDILLIDLEIPKINGIEAIKHINKMSNPPVSIVTTANTDNALEAYSVNVFSYLLKPVRENKLRDAIARAKRYTQKSKFVGTKQTSAVLDQAEKYHICCRNGKNLELIGISDISHLHAENKCTFVFHKGGRVTISDQSLRLFLGEFRHWLLQIHRNTLVNKSYISSLRISNHGCGFVCLKGVKNLLSVSRRNLPEVRRYVRSYIHFKHGGGTKPRT